jgi:hypothetical protein
MRRVCGVSQRAALGEEGNGTSRSLRRFSPKRTGSAQNEDKTRIMSGPNVSEVRNDQSEQ